MVIQINSIEISNRKRSLNSDKVAEIAESFKLLGQLEPITVVKVNENRYRLIAGWHRLEAAKLLGWEKIEAKIFEGDSLECELAEIDENLMHNDLTVLEQGEQLFRRNEILKELGLRAKSGDNQFRGGAVTVTAPQTTEDNQLLDRPRTVKRLEETRGGEIVSPPQTIEEISKEAKGEMVSPLETTEEIAKEAGLSERSAQQRLQVARDIDPEVKEVIRNTPIADSTTQLLKLARFEPEKQKKIAEKIINSGAKDIRDAQKLLKEEERAKIAREGELIEPDNRWAIYQGDITTWQAPRQYDFIITDPPYPKEYLPLWKVLARRTLEWLKPGGLLIAMSGHSYLDQIYAILNEYLKYYWTAAYLTPGQPTPLNYIKKVNTTWKPLLIYSVGEYKGKIFGDVFKSDSSDKTFHDWGQSGEWNVFYYFWNLFAWAIYSRPILWLRNNRCCSFKIRLFI